MSVRDDDSLWGELRSLLNETPGHDALSRLCSLLSEHPRVCAQRSLQEYVVAHLSRWDAPRRTGWEGEFAQELDWLKPHCVVLTTRVFAEVSLKPTTPAVHLHTPCGVVELAGFSGNLSLNSLARHAGHGSTEEGADVYAWDTPRCRVELEIVPLGLLNHEAPLIDGGYVATWVVIADEDVDPILIRSTCAPSSSVGPGSASSGEWFESIQWESEPVGRAQDGRAIRRHLCVGSHDAEAMEGFAGSWWPLGQPSHVQCHTNTLDLLLPPLLKGQRCLVRSAGSWGVYSEERVDTWLTSDQLLTMRALPKDMG